MKLVLADVHDSGGLRPMDDDVTIPVVSPDELAEFSAKLKDCKCDPWGGSFSFSALAASANMKEEEQRKSRLAASVAASNDETTRLWSRAHELLRHYWSCFPVASPRTALKVCRWDLLKALFDCFLIFIFAYFCVFRLEKCVSPCHKSVRLSRKSLLYQPCVLLWTRLFSMLSLWE